MANQGDMNVTRENEDRFLFKMPAVPLFPAARSAATGPSEGSSDAKANQMNRKNMRPGQPFWKAMTQSDNSPLQLVNKGEGVPSPGLGNNQIRGGGNDIASPFRRNFRGAGEIPPFNLPRDGEEINPFMKGLPHLQQTTEGANINPPIPRTFDYNHGVPYAGGPNGPGGPSGQGGPSMGPPNRPGRERPPLPISLMEVTIPNPAALFQRLHATLEEKRKSSARRDPRQEGLNLQSPQQRNDSQTRQAGPSGRQGNQSKQKGSPNKGGNAQKKEWNSGLKRRTEQPNQLGKSDQTSKKRKIDPNTNRSTESKKSNAPPVLEYDAESLKLMDAISQGSQAHQLQLIKAIGIKDNFTGRAMTPWKCYICDSETWTWQGYISHCKTKEHKSQAIGLGTTFMKDERTKVLNVLKKLPHARVSFSIGKDSGDGSAKSSNPSSTPTSTPPALAEAVTKKKGMFECKPCGRFFLQRDKLQSHMTSENHLKRDTFLKQRFGNSYLDYHWYNQTKKSERRDVEPQGIAFVLPVSGYFCKLCSRFYNSEITAKDVHCRQMGHIDKVKEWDRQQLTKKEAVKLKLNATEIETAVKNKQELAARIAKWSRPTINTNLSEVVIVDSDPEDENDQKKNKKATEKGQKGGDSTAKKEVSKAKDEDLEEGELSEVEVLRMEKQQQEDRIREEWMKREAKKKEREQREKELRERERKKEKEAKEQKEKEQREKERKEKEAKERKEKEQREKERKEKEAKERKEKQERERREKERREREEMMKKLQQEKRQLELKKKEFQEQVEKEKKEKEERERKEREEKEKLEKSRKLIEDKEKKLQEKQQLEIFELETRIRQQEKREKELLEERLRLGQMLAMGPGTHDSAAIEVDMKDAETRVRIVREQVDEDVKRLEELKRKQLGQVVLYKGDRQEEYIKAKVEAELKKAEEQRLREERLKEVEKREKELLEIEKREKERQRIEEKERELLEIQMRDKARREQELKERQEQEMLAIRELERKARLEEQMQARQEQEMLARGKQEMQVRAEQEMVRQDMLARQQQEITVKAELEMKARKEQEMKARKEQEMQARQQQEMQARQQQEIQARQQQEIQARQQQEMRARQQQEIQARQQQEIQARLEQEMQARLEQEMQARREQEMGASHKQEIHRLREQEILARREQDIQAWRMREDQMIAEGVSQMEILEQRQVFQQQLDEKYNIDRPLSDIDARMTGETWNAEMERELFLNDLRQKARGELMMKAVQLQREGLTDDEIQEVMAREEEIMKQRIFEEMQSRGFTDVGAPSGHVEDREVDSTAEQGMPYVRDEREWEHEMRDNEWGLTEEDIERERQLSEREMMQRSSERDFDERDNRRYIEEAGGPSVEGTVGYDKDYPPSPGNYNEGDDYDNYNSDDGSYREGDFDDDYYSVQGNDEGRNLTGSINRDDVRAFASRRGGASIQSRQPRQRTGDRRRRKKGGRGGRRRQGRGGAAQRGR